ncbi:spore coat putative kinase YutH [Shouchella sp. 1P09AA]|uniref:spore coat putative kinase YutH n=1 Tax=unclassified Shouchella TaxID=2893065 RepID=UPI0039A0817D
MLERNLYDHYKLYCTERFAIGEFEGFQANQESYLIIPKEELQMEEAQMLAFSDYMRTAGDHSVLELVQNRSNQPSTLIDGTEVYVFHIPSVQEERSMRIRSTHDLGGQLKGWHARGQQGAGNWTTLQASRWPSIWEQRLEQLENWYAQKRATGPSTQTDELFLYTYPYFMGMTENAIQYAVDTEMDIPMEPRDSGTICHNRFKDTSWLKVSESGQIIKLPTTFLFDHPARDLAEWIRDRRVQQEQRQTQQDIASFMSGYEETQVLSRFSWQLMYSRLLFPLHYFELIEHYYRAQIPGEQLGYSEQLSSFLDKEKQNGAFLNELAEDAKLHRYQSIPELDWIIGQKI